MKQTKRTEISSVGEFGLINHIREKITNSNPSTIKGIGDDAAVLRFESENILVSTDMLAEGIHFDLSYVPLLHLGFKAVSVNVSDIYAMNGTPTQITVSLALSNRFSLEAVDELYEGIKVGCKHYGVDLVGGDTTTSRSGLIISITAIGTAAKEEIVCRSGARLNDLLCITGDVGGAYLGLQLLEREKEVFLNAPAAKIELEGYEYILQRQLRPEARKDIPLLLKKLDVRPTAMIDVSDGISSETLHICTSSGVGCNMYEEKIPVAPQTSKTAQEFHLDPTVCALSGGEDYELLFTIRQEDYPKITGNPDITVIGHILDQQAGYNLITRSGSSTPLLAQGWDSLLNKN